MSRHTPEPRSPSSSRLRSLGLGAMRSRHAERLRQHRYGPHAPSDHPCVAEPATIGTVGAMKATRAAATTSIVDERARVAWELSQLASELEHRDAAVAELIGRLVEAVRQGKQEEVRGYVEAIEPRALAELLVNTRSAFWGIIDVARNVLVFAPIAVTWFGLSTAAAAYATLIGLKPDLVNQPFLLLFLSLSIRTRSEIGDVSTRTRALLRESQIRALIGHAMAATTSVEIGSATADAILDQMVAEERRIYERAMEREQQLFDLEGAVGEIRRAATELARAAEALNGQHAAEADPAQPAPPRS